jgi:hypothetical protein
VTTGDGIGFTRGGEDKGYFTPWGEYTPTLVWGTGTPASITKQGRYCRVGFVCFFSVYIGSADSNAASSLTVTLPIAPVDNTYDLPVSAVQLAGAGGATYSKPSAYIDVVNAVISFRAFTTGTDGQNIKIWLRGSYEVA